MTNNEGKQKAKDKSDERHDSITTQDLFIKGFSDYCKTTTPTPEQVKPAISIMNCRTMRLGGHMYTCKSCGNQLKRKRAQREQDRFDHAPNSIRQAGVVGRGT